MTTQESTDDQAATSVDEPRAEILALVSRYPGITVDELSDRRDVSAETHEDLLDVVEDLRASGRLERRESDCPGDDGALFLPGQREALTRPEPLSSREAVVLSARFFLSNRNTEPTIAQLTEASVRIGGDPGEVRGEIARMVVAGKLDSFSGPLADQAPAALPSAPEDWDLADYEHCTPEHARILRDSAISPEVQQGKDERGAAWSGKFTAKGGKKHPGLIFAYHHPDGTRHHVARLDTPRKGAKYLAEEDGRGLNVHPLIGEHLGDPSRDLVVVEGTRQYLAVVTALRGLKIAVVGINGIYGWGWNPGNAPGTPLPDWGHIPLRARNVYTVPDGDWTTKDGVRRGADALDAFLSGAGGEVRRVAVPMLAGQDNTGADDWLASLPMADRKAALLGLMEEARSAEDDGLFIDRGQLDDLPPVEPLIDGMLNKSSIVWLSGKFGTYKTFVALSWALSVATGKPWNGRKVSEPGGVVYVAAEGYRGLSSRIRAWEAGANGGAPADRLTLTSKGLDPRRPDHMASLRRVVEEKEAKLVVFDTLHRCTPGFEENSNTEAGEIFGALQRLKDETGVTVLVLHHTGHSGERARGASSMEDDADDAYVITLKGDPEDRSSKNARVLTRRKSKEGEAGEAFPLELHAAEGGAAYVSAFTGAADEFLMAEGPKDTPTMKLAKWLDSIGAPVGLGRDGLKVWVMAQGFEYTARNDVWSAAVQLRKNRTEMGRD